MVVNADSAQVYRDLQIISARPGEADEARAEHLLYGYRDGAEACSAADWAADARAAIDRLHGRNRLPILVGGTGLYLRALLDGIAPVPPIDPQVRAEVRARGVEENRESLGAADPAMAARLGARDSQRIARALEVVRSTGRSLLDWQREGSGGIGSRVRTIGLVPLPPRAWLAERCDARFAAMLGEEGMAEAERLRARRLDPTLPVMTAIGARELMALAAGSMSRDDALISGCAATRRYAKRQYTWFRNQAPASWVRLEEPLTGQEIARQSALFAHRLAET